MKPLQAADTQLGMMDNYGDGTIKDQYPNIGWEKGSHFIQGGPSGCHYPVIH